MRLLAGTSGFSYKEWKGRFYPEDLPAKKMLGYYAERLPTVEINNTFYRMPKTSVVESWAAQVPETFRFSVKASRRITHFKRLKGVEEETATLLRCLAPLGDRLGALLFQLPPQLKCDLERLDAFLELLPEGTPAAFEFRNETWFDDAVAERLAGAGAALAVSETDDGEDGEPRVTAPFGYLRLRRSAYTREQLEAWAARLAGLEWDHAFVFFKHEDAGAGPRMAARFLELADRGTS